MLQAIADQGDPAQRHWALQTIATSDQIREQRRAFAEMIERATPTAAPPRKERIVYDAENMTTLPGRRVRVEGEPPTGDPAIDEAYDGAGATFDLYQDMYERNSIDNNGMTLISTVHYGASYDNAFWDGQQMVYGDGDGDLPEHLRLFNRFTIAIDIIAHELTHGVTQYEAGLVYQDQAGALNESFSDVFGSLVKQRGLNQTAGEADWLIGAGLFTSNVTGQGIRSMKDPGTAYDDPIVGKDPQPGHMDNYVYTTQDNGGVHINSGIPNRAFCVTALEMGGFAWEKAGRIWYVTLRERLAARSTFQHAANQTYRAAAQLFGPGSLEQQAVLTGWAEVGINAEIEGGEAAQGCLPTINTALRPVRAWLARRAR
ncbi:MAG: M4 family metallopeptidase [Anaerolineae bacterium]|nr:M4 family metallopeptidase [Anaerolineae bacterium]